MGHNIHAVIGKKAETNTAIIKKYQLAAAFEKEYTIIILFDDSLFHWSDVLGSDIESESENLRWASPIVFKIAEEIGFEKYAIIQTDYFAGLGGQIASLYENATCLLKETDINDVLKELGVVTSGKNDEFDELNLGEYRTAELYYWDENNQADEMPNMIAGKVPEDYKFR
ncbi:MAG: hypothetical protein A3D31_08225 [Candidatus Fluviicola riflensis]|nr:MAG: hypothetical protein CHH17_06780 [Candidatus Fluviicola riflensis]OGS79926.1 MAG: hypothetical protein A3D31_08225 [Candidatus Fluviicola riflensis]OGS82441.1 MAG: hypothetical protein A2724_17170 [Fluviicola sp. RIFCSPHIGHO2_01_FULL_43_53]OGS88105.1 MAG: hypothetical protein A3E30_14605 [Fluviicola sp. RIFCSPHIGHO2_12_FULL_43_24]